MSHRILSLYFGHDANLCLLEDGEPVLVLEKERATRTKHDQGHMLDLLPRLLGEHGWDPDSIDLVVINPYTRSNLQGVGFRWELEGPTYLERPEYKTAGWRGPPEERTSRHRLRLFGRQYESLAVDHHLAHAAAALFTSGFESAGIISADGGGDDRFCALASGRGHRIDWIEYDWGTREAFPESQLNIGSTWAVIGEQNFGYRRLEAAGKLMGLSSYAEAPERMVELIDHHAQFYWRFPFPTFLYDRIGRILPEEPFAHQLAAALEAFTTRRFLAAAQRLKDLEPGVEQICLTGGCAMNCVANAAVHTSGLVADTFVPAQPHDGGLALGQALYAWHHVLDNPRRARAWSPYLGTDIGPAPDGAEDEVVDALLEGCTVGIAHGRAESGPRALGHRSILADPRTARIKQHLNDRVKNREGYRPFAPAVLAEHFDDWFEGHVPSRYMSYTATVRPGRRGQLAGITHVDGTARPQLVHADGDPFYRAILERWHRKTGVPVLLNTSLNCQEPLVDTEEQAISTWRRSGLDLLVTTSGVRRKQDLANSA